LLGAGDTLCVGDVLAVGDWLGVDDWLGCPATTLACASEAIPAAEGSSATAITIDPAPASTNTRRAKSGAGSRERKVPLIWWSGPGRFMSWPPPG
jgi:hypothetical protein